MKTKQRNLFVALILSVAIIFGTFGALSLTNVNKASALSSVTVDQTITDFETVNSRLKITQNAETTIVNGTYVIPYWNFTWADVDRMEYSIDILKCSQFRMFITNDGHFLDKGLPSYNCYVENGALTFTRYAESQYYGAKDVAFDGYTVKFPAPGDVTKLSIPVEYGFNFKVTYYGANYSAVSKSSGAEMTDVGTIINYTITPYNEDGTQNTETQKDIFFYSAKNKGVYNTTSNYHVGLVMLGENLVSVVDNAKLVKYTSNEDSTGAVITNNTMDNSLSIENVPYGNKLNASVRNNAGSREFTNEIFNNADGIVSKGAITDKQFVVDGQIDLTSLGNGKKFGLLTGMDAKSDNVGMNGTSFVYFTNIDGVTYIGADDNGVEVSKQSLGANLEGTKISYVLQFNADGNVVATVNGSKLFFTIPRENVNGYISYKSSGAGTVNASVDATTINTYNVVGEMSKGASIRLGTLDNSGMRFETTFTKETVDALANAGYKSIEYGTLITRADLLNGSSVTIEELSAKSIWHKTIVSTISDPDAEDKVYCGSLISINAQNFGKEFIGRGYVKVVDANDNVIYFYADFFGGSVANNTRSVKWIAEQYQASEEYNYYLLSLKTGDVNVVEAYINGVSNVG